MTTMRRRLIPVLLAVPLLASCTSTVKQARTSDYYDTPTASGTEAGKEAAIASFFPPDDRHMTDAEIERALQARVTLRPKISIGIVPLAHRSVQRVRSWSWESAPPERSLFTGTVKTLRQSENVFDVSFVPSVLLAGDRSMAALRSAGARAQADELLFVQSDCRIDRRPRLMSASEATARCTVEVALLDVRTGVFPFNSVAVREFRASQDELGERFSETVERAEREAFDRGMAENSENLLAFLKATYANQAAR